MTNTTTMDLNWGHVWRLLATWPGQIDLQAWQHMLNDVPPGEVVEMLQGWADRGDVAAGGYRPTPAQVKAAWRESRPAPVVREVRMHWGVPDVEAVIALGKSVGGDEGREYVEGFWRSVADGVTVVRPEIARKYRKQIEAARLGVAA